VDSEQSGDSFAFKASARQSLEYPTGSHTLARDTACPRRH
jgi:hypothetical protein